MKKVLTILLSMLMALALTACSSSKEETKTNLKEWETQLGETEKYQLEYLQTIPHLNLMIHQII